MSKDGLFCSDSPYNEHDLNSLEGVYNMYSDKDSKGGSSDPLGMELYHYEPEACVDGKWLRQG